VSGRQLAALSGWHFTKVSKIEHGRSTPSDADIELWCFHCGAESQIADLTAAARGIEKMYIELRRLPRLRLGVLPARVRRYMTFGGFWMFDDREAQMETYSAAVRITQPSEIALYAKVFEHYSRRAVYGQQARDLISQAVVDLGND